MWLYLVPVAIFLVMSIFLTFYDTDDKKNKIKIKAIVPSFIVSVLVFLAIKYNEMTHEPMMPGNYFDPV
jgi:hypothetical protein